MAMYLGGVPVFTIMLLGRWSSDAFLRYICKQVKEFSKGVSNKMITNENFFTISNRANVEGTGQNNSFLPSKLDPRSHNGACFKGTIAPLISVFH
jgi:hypothetical protein